MKKTIFMVLQIFKKDGKLLWPFVLGLAGVQFASAATQFVWDRWFSMVYTYDGLLGIGRGLAFGYLFAVSRNPNRTLFDVSLLSSLLVLSKLLMTAFLIAAVVHQDTIPGVRKDWLVRPIKRMDLLLAKLLFVLVMVHGPILLADVAEGLANGLPFSQLLAAAVAHGLYLLIGFSVPVLAFSSLTRSMTEAVIGGMVVFLCFAVLAELPVTEEKYAPAMNTGLMWIAQSASLAFAFLGAGAILALQYFRRKTTPARWLTAGVVFLWFLAQFMPWQFAFAVQRRLSPKPGAGAPIELAFEPHLPKFQLPPGMRRHGWAEASAIYLPLRVGGLPASAVLKADNAEVRLVAANGKVVYKDRPNLLELRNEGHRASLHFTIPLNGYGEEDFGPVGAPAGEAGQDDSTGWIYQRLSLPDDLYSQIKEQPLRLEIDYSLTLLGENSSYTMPAVSGDQEMAGVGLCKTEIDKPGNTANLHCVGAGLAPHCSLTFLEHVPSGKRNPVNFFCRPNYSPYFDNYVPDAMGRFGSRLSIQDRSDPTSDFADLAKYPIGITQLPESQVHVLVYRAQDHFTRKLVIPEIRLSDWESVARDEPAVCH